MNTQKTTGPYERTLTYLYGAMEWMSKQVGAPYNGPTDPNPMTKEYVEEMTDVAIVAFTDMMYEKFNLMNNAVRLFKAAYSDSGIQPGRFIEQLQKERVELLGIINNLYEAMVPGHQGTESDPLRGVYAFLNKSDDELRLISTFSKEEAQSKIILEFLAPLIHNGIGALENDKKESARRNLNDFLSPKPAATTRRPVVKQVSAKKKTVKTKRK